MDWQQLRNAIYYLGSSLRDIYIHGTTKNDWLAWSDFVNQNYKTSFYISETALKEDKIDMHKAFRNWNGPDHDRSYARTSIDNIQIQTYFFTDKEIENDIAPTEINSLDDHLKLVDYMIRLSKILQKKVILTPENTPEIKLITINQDDVTVDL